MTRIKASDIKVTVVNPELMTSNSNLAKITVEVFTKDLTNEQLKYLIDKVKLESDGIIRGGSHRISFKKSRKLNIANVDKLKKNKL